MANIKSNAKSNLKAKKLRQKHKAEKSFLRNRIKTAKTTCNLADFNLAMKALDAKAAKGLIKKQTANRLKSRLAIHINKSNSAKNEGA